MTQPTEARLREALTYLLGKMSRVLDYEHSDLDSPEDHVRFLSHAAGLWREEIRALALPSSPAMVPGELREAVERMVDVADQQAASTANDAQQRRLWTACRDDLRDVVKALAALSTEPAPTPEICHDCGGAGVSGPGPQQTCGRCNGSGAEPAPSDTVMVPRRVVEAAISILASDYEAAPWESLSPFDVLDKLRAMIAAPAPLSDYCGIVQVEEDWESRDAEKVAPLTDQSEESVLIADVLVHLKLCDSLDEAHRLVRGGGAYIDGRRVQALHSRVRFGQSVQAGRRGSPVILTKESGRCG